CGKAHGARCCAATRAARVIASSSDLPTRDPPSISSRSKSPAAVTQEMWGLLIAYNLVRLEMQRIASEFDVAPTRISFVASLCRDCVARNDSQPPRDGARPNAHVRAATRSRRYLAPRYRRVRRRRSARPTLVAPRGRRDLHLR